MSKFLISTLLIFASFSVHALDALEERAQKLDKMLIAPCCWAKTLDQEQSREAVEMKEEIRFKLAQGISEQEILDAFEGRFGERILAEPKQTGFNLTVWFFPFVILIVGGLILAKFLRSQKKKESKKEKVTDDGKEPKLSAADEKYRKMIDQELYRPDQK